MRPKLITYQRLYPIGAFANERLGMEVELNEVDSPEAAYQYAKETIDKWHRQQNPQLYQSVIEYQEPNYDGSGADTLAIDDEVRFPQPKKDPKKEATSRMIEAISGCTTLKSLETFKLLAEKSKDENIQLTYQNKLNELQ